MKKKRSIVIIVVTMFIITLLIAIYPENIKFMVENDNIGFEDDNIQPIERHDGQTSLADHSRYNIARNQYVAKRIENNIWNTFQLDKSKYIISYPQDRSCYFRDALRQYGLPDIHSIFADPIGKYVVFVGLKLSTDKWSYRTFICDFPDGEIIKSDHILEDRLSFGWLPQYIVVITCRLPERYLNRQNFQINFRIIPSTISETNIDVVNGAYRIGATTAYENVTVCQADTSRKHFLAMCTMVKQVDEFIPSWLIYHKYMGVDHVYIYDNADTGGNSSMKLSLRAFIDSGFVTVIPWAHTKSPNKTYLEIQIAHENDCLWRHRHHTLWMIKTDVDEYIQPMDTLRPKIIDYLKDPKLYSLGGLRIQNWFFGRPHDLPTPDGNIIERNYWRSKIPTLHNTGHDKNILRPINVHYFKIHAIKLGGEVKSLDPFTELRLVHYRGDNPRYLHFKLPNIEVKDTSMVEIWKRVVEETRTLNKN